MDKETSRAFIRRVDEVLWQVWDPIGVNDQPAARDEYSSYAPHVAGLLRSAATDAEIEGHLARIVLEQMGMTWMNPDRARRTLSALRSIPVGSERDA